MDFKERRALEAKKHSAKKKKMEITHTLKRKGKLAAGNIFYGIPCLLKKGAVQRVALAYNFSNCIVDKVVLSSDNVFIIKVQYTFMRVLPKGVGIQWKRNF